MIGFLDPLVLLAILASKVVPTAIVIAVVTIVSAVTPITTIQTTAKTT